MYCGKKQHAVDDVNVADNKSGPAAVVRNLRAVFGNAAQTERRLIVTDRFYTSVALALQLLAMGYYTIGTIMGNRYVDPMLDIPMCRCWIYDNVGFQPRVLQSDRGEAKEQTSDTSSRAPHRRREQSSSGDVRVYVVGQQTRSVSVYAGSTELDRVARRERNGTQTEVPCPKFVKDYQPNMGGVDVHDQLRLQR